MTREEEQQQQAKAEKGMKQQTARSEMKVDFGEYMGSTCESIYRPRVDQQTRFTEPSAH